MLGMLPTVIAFFFALSSYAQYHTGASRMIPPQWIKKTPVASNGTFSYEIVHSVGETLENARQKCLEEILERTGMENGLVILSGNDNEETVSQTWSNGKLEETVQFKSKSKTITKGSEFKLFIKDIDEYWTIDSEGRYRLTKLYAVSEINAEADFDDVMITSHYGARGVWRSALIPGWGQMFKGCHLKGGLILGSAAAFTGGIIFCENMRKDRNVKISQTHDINLIRKYSADAANLALGRNLCIGGAALVYLYGIIDAAVAPGGHRIISIGKKGRPYAHSYVSPAVTADGTVGIAARLTF